MKHDQKPLDKRDIVALAPVEGADPERRYRTERERLLGKRRGVAGLLDWFGIGGAEAQDAAEQVQSPKEVVLDPTSRKIFIFLQMHGLDASPDHFQLAWTYIVSPLNKLSIAVDKVLASDERLTESVAARLLSEYRASSVANDLAGLLVQAREGITDGSKVVKQSRDDVAAFGDALRSELDETLAQPDKSADASGLLKLTETMITKASEAEQELRALSSQLAKMEKRVRTAERLAETDPLTGLPNRRAFTDSLEQAIARSRFKGQPLGVVFCDIDHFKLVNDTHGHATGDRVLKYVASALSAAANGSCHVARHGGEEFVMLFKDQPIEIVREVVDAVREGLAQKRLVAMDTEQPIGTVTFSAGIAMLEPDQTAGDLLHKADMALYRAKHAGRNCVSF